MIDVTRGTSSPATDDPGTTAEPPTTEPPTSTSTAETSSGETTTAVLPTTGTADTGDTTSSETTTSATTTSSTTTAESTGSSSGGPGCLDGIVDTGEQCDDGNELPGDGCELNCRHMFRPAELQVGGARHLAAADLDGDGKSELIVARDDFGLSPPDVVVLVHAGDDDFTAQPFDDEIYANVGQVVVGQFAGDALPDLVIVNPDGPGARLWINVTNGPIAFQQDSLGDLASLHISGAAALRLDAMPWDDLVLLSPAKNLLFLVDNSGGLLDQPPTTVPTELPGPTALVAAPFQLGDAVDDVIVTHPAGIDLSEYRGLGNGSLMPLEATVQTCAGDPGGPGVGDADGLGARNDVVIACTDGSVTLYANDGMVRSLAEIAAGQLGTPASAGFLDIYGDGDESDLFVLSSAPKDLRIVVRRNGEVIVAPPIPLTAFGSTAVAVDLDDDGAQDLAVVEPGAGLVQLFFNQTQLPLP